jgi:hypothetical protein
MSSATVLKLPVNNSFLFMTVLLPWDYWRMSSVASTADALEMFVG